MNYNKWSHRVRHELMTKTATKTKQLWLFLGWTWPSQVHPVKVSMPSQKAQVCFCWPGRKQTAMLWAICGGNQLTRTWGWPVVFERYPGDRQFKKRSPHSTTTRNWKILGKDRKLQMRPHLVDILISVLWDPEQRMQLCYAWILDLQELWDLKWVLF